MIDILKSRLRAVALLCVIGAVAAGCAADPAPMTAADRAAIAEEVGAALDAFADAERARDLDAMLSFLDPSFYMYGDGVRVDYDTVVAGMRATIPTLQRFETTWSDIEVNVVAPDYAFVTMIFRDAIPDDAGVTTRARGPNTFVWRRVEGQWRIIYVDADHYPDNEQ